MLHGDCVNDHSPLSFYFLAALAIFSLGLQTCALKQVAGKMGRTAYVSGVLTNMTQEAVNYLFPLPSRQGARRRTRRPNSCCARWLAVMNLSRVTVKSAANGTRR